jgi:hypothetical protein
LKEGRKSVIFISHPLFLREEQDAVIGECAHDKYNIEGLSFQCFEADEAFYEVLAAALPSNSTLRLECSG